MENQVNEVRLEISVREFTKKETGEKFLGYKAFTKKGKYDLRFTKEVENLPTKSCIIFVPQDKVNLNRNGRYPTIWVSEILRIEDYSNKFKVEDYFDVI